MEGAYTVKTHVFEGPLDLLLELVTKRKLFVNDVSLAQVADDFVSYVEAQGEVPLSESAEFILVASTLMLIKSRSLLPTLELTQEEEESIHDLEHRLAVYARVKELAALLRGLYGQQVIFEKEPRKNDAVIFTPDSKTDVANIHAALERLIMALPKKEALPKVLVKKVISLEEMIERLSERVAKAGRMSFRDFHGNRGALTHEKKVSIIVGFLAMLELVKRGAIRVSQEGGEIGIEREGDSVDIPTYA
jgi:segregation and condensation protein A